MLCTKSQRYKDTQLPIRQSQIFTKSPLCWRSVTVYTVSALRILLSWVVIVPVLFFLRWRFKMADRHIALLGVVSSVLCNGVLAVAQVNFNYWVLTGISLGVMMRSTAPMLRSVSSSLVDRSRHATLYSGLSAVEILGRNLFDMAANTVYKASQSLPGPWDGEIFLFFACVMIFALILLVILNVLYCGHSELPTELPQPPQGGNIQDSQT